MPENTTNKEHDFRISMIKMRARYIVELINKFIESDSETERRSFVADIKQHIKNSEMDMKHLPIRTAENAAGADILGACYGECYLSTFLGKNPTTLDLPNKGYRPMTLDDIREARDSIQQAHDRYPEMGESWQEDEE